MSHPHPISTLSVAALPSRLRLSAENARLFPLLRAITFLLLLLVIPTPAHAANLALTRYNSKQYTIYTNLDREEVKEFAAHMDAVFSEYQRRFASFKQRNHESPALYLFHTQEQYIEFMAQHGINAANSGGMFFIQNDLRGLATWTADKSRVQTFEVLQHEGFHQFAFAYIGPDLPVWLNEGLAQYFEDGILVNERLVLGMVNADRLANVRAALAVGKAIDFDRLIKISSDQWSKTLATDAEQAALLYDQAWTVVYFLIHAEGGKYRPAFEQMLVQLSKGRSVDTAFRQAFGTQDTTAFGQRWREWVKAAQPDPLSVAATRMTFLGQAISFLREKKMDVPDSIGDLQRLLARVHFVGTRTRHGVTVTFKGSDASFYEYPLPSGKGSAPFQLKRNPAPNAPPLILAPKLSPVPTLDWIKDAKGQYVSEIRYQ
ncbi:MAG: DUF1570 domain-containing protein [Phycisphaeraceae bacterium]